MTAPVTSPYAFLVFVLCGVALGCVYSVYIALRRFSAQKKLLCGLYDMLFWAVTLAAFIAALLLSTAGVLRFFELLGFLLGFGICLAGPGAYITKSISVLLHSVKRIIAKLNQKLADSLEKSDNKG